VTGLPSRPWSSRKTSSSSFTSAVGGATSKPASTACQKTGSAPVEAKRSARASAVKAARGNMPPGSGSGRGFPSASSSATVASTWWAAAPAACA